ncbi:toll/interleukin-1 receptor domain-containing protein [Peribacillus acanthi]|uniref:toll/interleukin-1 receptor domain-containing protein n=1 Tax=Peribacillus acanthi TaxID=2171554 RepID=UPI00130093E6|nr:toll/interleukin-1 receptor domain-containing protein [Peribacillus acanthi]
MQRKRVFISYSWDSEAHQEWILYLANRLRDKGLIAEADVFETQQKSVHLNRMMVEKVKDSDYIIIVLTENYARKADNFEGGVGFESQLTLPLLMENPNKLVPIMRHQGDFNKVFPFHFKGHYAVDFSKDETFEAKFEELIYRLYEKPRFFVQPVGEVPTLEPKIPSRLTTEQPKSIPETAEFDFSDLDIQSHKRITDREIEKFMKDSFKQMVRIFKALFTQLESTNPNFEFDQDDVDSRKTIFNLYNDGRNATTIKIWYGGSFGRNSINLSYGRHITMSDNSTNEMIYYETDDKNQLKLKMTMNFLGNKIASTPDEIVKEVWRSHISHHLK